MFKVYKIAAVKVLLWENKNVVSRLAAYHNPAFDSFTIK